MTQSFGKPPEDRELVDARGELQLWRVTGAVITQVKPDASAGRTFPVTCNGCGKPEPTLYTLAAPKSLRSITLCRSCLDDVVALVASAPIDPEAP